MIAWAQELIRNMQSLLVEWQSRKSARGGIGQRCQRRTRMVLQEVRVRRQVPGRGTEGRFCPGKGMEIAG